MRNKHLRQYVLTGLAFVASMALSAPASAQAVSKAPQTSQWVSVVVALLLACLMFVISFKSAKRGHQD